MFELSHTPTDNESRYGATNYSSNLVASNEASREMYSKTGHCASTRVLHSNRLWMGSGLNVPTENVLPLLIDVHH